MTGKKHRWATYCVVGIVLLGLGCVGWFWLSELAVVKEAPYDVEVVDTPQVHGTLYTAGRLGYLLVLSAPGTSPQCASLLDLSRRTMGIVPLPRHIPLGRFALVHGKTLEGYCETCGGLAAVFGTRGDSTTILVTGWAAESGPPDEDTKSFLREMLIYENRIILKPRRDNA